MMKKNSILSLVIAMFISCDVVFVSCATQEERAARKAEQAKMVTDALGARKYKIDITRMIPGKGPSRSVSTYSIEVRNDSLISYLPYIGRAYKVPYGGGNGLNFSAPISSYNETIKKNGRRDIEISVANNEDTYLYTLMVFDNGSSSLTVQSRQREQISYSGNMVLCKNPETH